MKRNTLLKIVNPLLAALIINQFLSGMLRHHLSRGAFEILHEDGALVLAAVAALHLILNWNWIKASYFKRKAVI